MAEEGLTKRSFKEVLADIQAKSAEKREKEAKDFKFREDKRAKDLRDATEKQTKQAAKDAGRLRVEGSDYLVKDGDVFHFRFNV